MDKHSAFATLHHTDAHYLAAAIAVDVLNHDEPAEPLQRRLSALVNEEDGVSWKDPRTVYHALAMAVQIASINR
ncbi:hypothetical protein MMAG44476_08541 [Mycolicibacterium mageritense DSM 44476 = CIP 104973]|uniref:Uncharacterized protein n=2 Tax=Mycobacteriaceae TaxID=1762 RepID=A0ABM7HQM2_MYCME|nr:hypothetical protein MMAGJ_21160 [Mycolicibacterium mageritense]